MSVKIAAALATATVLAAPVAAVAAPAAAPVVTAAPTSARVYVAATHTGSTAQLRLVDRSTGATTKVLTTARMLRDGSNPFYDATIAPDGTVWAVRGGTGTYSNQLLRIKDGRTSVFLPYVSGARISPDGRRIAVSIVSPDANRDGKGTVSLRVLPVKGGAQQVLAQSTFPVDRRGEPTGEVVVPVVSTWLGTSRLAVARGCCGQGQVSIVRADKPTTMRSWPTISGGTETYPIARYRQDAVLVPRETTVGRGTVKDPVRTTGYDLLRVSAAKPLGVKVGRVGANSATEAELRRFVARTGGVALDSAYTDLRYKPVATLDRQFTSR